MKRHKVIAIVLILGVGLLFSLSWTDSGDIIALAVSSDFSTFLPDLLVEFISVLILGVIVSNILEIQRRRYEATQQEKLTSEAKRRYLINIKREISANNQVLSPYKKYQNLPDLYFQKRRGLTDQKSEADLILAPFKTTYWDALVPSGLLPAIVSEGLLADIADYYHQLRVIKGYVENLRAQANSMPHSEDAMMNAFRLGAMRRELSDQMFDNLFPLTFQALSQGEQLMDLLALEITQSNLNTGSTGDGVEAPIFANEAITERTSIDTERFEDIRIVALDQQLTSKPDPNKDDYQVVLQLSDEPPKEWGKQIDFGEKLQRGRYGDTYSVKYEAMVIGRYLDIKMSLEELKSNFGALKQAVVRKNLNYKERLSKKRDEAEQELVRKEKEARELKTIGETLDFEMTNIVVENLGKDEHSTGDDTDSYDNEPRFTI